MTQLPPTLSRAEAHLYFATWIVMRSPLILSADFAHNAPRRSGSNWPSWILPLVKNEHAIAISQDALSAQGHRLWSSGVNGSNTNASAVFVPPGELEIWSGPLANGDSAVMLANRGERIARINNPVALQQLGCVIVSVYDVFGKRELGSYARRYIRTSCVGYAFVA